jgi:phosphopantothenate--cysteine ligase
MLNMKILITAGGTSEKIDRVREISNRATGKLGSLTAEEFVRQGRDRIEKIIYVCEQGTIVPSLPCVEVVSVEGVEDVKNTLTDILSSHQIDAVIHSMAVSDYAVKNVTTVENLSEFIANRIFPISGYSFENEIALARLFAAYIKENDRILDTSGKVGSNIESPILTLKQTPKIIGLIKDLRPSTVLVGFKLLDDVPKERLLEAGYELLVKNNCDFVLANDLQDIRDGRHIGLLISPDKSYHWLETKAEIAQDIVRKVLAKIDMEEKQP